MEQWNFYTSGILYGRVWFEGDGVRHQWRDPFTGVFSEKGLLTEEENQDYLAQSGPDLRKLAGLLEAYCRDFDGARDETIVTRFGETYVRRADGLYAQRHRKFPWDVQLADGKLCAFICPNRDRVGVLVKAGFEEHTILSQWKAYAPAEKIYPVRFLGTFSVPMRDGITLETDVYLPEGPGEPVPAMLVRTPYGRQNGKEVYYRYVQRGYAVVIQDVRGCNDSEGVFMPCCNETEDGDDTLNWIASQPWSSQKIGMLGGSYLGFVQWAAAASKNPYLCALISVVTSGGAFVDVPRRGGCFTSGMLSWAFAVSKKKFDPSRMVRDDWEQVLDIRPLRDIPKRALGYEIPFVSEWLSHPENDSFWKRSDWLTRCEGVQIPALIISGWFDDNGMGTTQALELTKNYPAGMRKAILGPWVHQANTAYDVHGVYMGENALRYDLDFLYLKWIDLYLKGIPNGIDATAPVEYYTLGQNRWKTAENWPVPHCKPVTLYLGGREEGALLPEAPEAAGRFDYLYDPKNPAPHLVDMSENELEVPEDYAQVEKREDVLSFTSETLPRDLTVTGDILVRLYVSSDAPDTDFVVRLTDVEPTGRSIKLADGMLCAKYRGGFEKAEWMEPGKIYALCIRTTKISNTFQKGHRIRLTITSSAKNFIFPNSNTVGGYDSSYTVTAHNTIHFGGKNPSQIILPTE